MSMKRFNPDDVIRGIESITTSTWSDGSGKLTSITQSTYNPNTNYYTNWGKTDSGPVEFSTAIGDDDGTDAQESNYIQYKNLICGGDTSLQNEFDTFFNTGFVAINIERVNYKERLYISSFKLVISTGTYEYTNQSPTNSDLGRLYEIDNSWVLPDVGIILIKGTTFASLTEFTLKSEENLSTNYYFIRGKNKEFNYSSNPSFLNEAGEFKHPEFIYNPRVYVTTVGLYNNSNELLAVAKLSKPLPKDFNREFLIRAKLSF